MATPVVTPSSIQSELSVFVHKVLYAHVGVLILLLALMGAGGYFGLRSYDKALAHAEALQTQFNTAQAQFTASQKQLTDLLAADSAQRAQESTQQATLTQQIIQRDAKTPAPAVQTALQPSADAEQLATGLELVFTGVPGFGVVQEGSGSSVLLNQAQTQAVIVSREAEITDSADLKDETVLYTLEQSKAGSLQKDLTSCESTLSDAKVTIVDANKTISAYKKLAHKSLFKKILGRAETVALVVVAFELGHKL